MKNKLMAISMLAGALAFAGCLQSIDSGSRSFSDLPSGRLAPSARTPSDSASSSMGMGSGASASTTVGSVTEGTSDSYRDLPSGRLAPSSRTRGSDGSAGMQ